MVSATALHAAFLSSTSSISPVAPGEIRAPFLRRVSRAAILPPPRGGKTLRRLLRPEEGSLVISTQPTFPYKKRDNSRSLLLDSKQPNDLDDMDNLDGESSSFDFETDAFDFLQGGEVINVETLEELLNELERYDKEFGLDNNDDDSMIMWDERSIEEILGNLTSSEEYEEIKNIIGDKTLVPTKNITLFREALYNDLEEVLLQGVVPVSAGVGSESLPGDFGFDPLHLADRDLFRPAQDYLLQLLPPISQVHSSNVSNIEPSEPVPPRPKALVLRDYREAEIRHGRIAMLAAMIWPIQEMVDRYILSDEQFGPLLYGPVTLPYFPLFMTAMLLLLGYLDIYSQAIKDMDQIGEAFLPGDCFWDPLQILEGAPNRMKRNMQERELFNGRAAMIAVAAYVLEEAVTHKALFEIGSNALLLRPVYEIPYIQRWLDLQFSFTHIDPTEIPSFDMMDAIDTFVETTMLLLS